MIIRPAFHRRRGMPNRAAAVVISTTAAACRVGNVMIRTA